MNANELADVMEKYSVAGFMTPLAEEFKQAATMLRQQQEKIDKLTAIVALREIEMEEMKKRNLFLESIYRVIKVREK
jgi:hypothetical protein